MPSDSSHKRDALVYAPVAVITAGVDALVNRDREVEQFFHKHAYGIDSVQKIISYEL